MRIFMKEKKLTSFESDLLEKLKNPEFAAAYLMTVIADRDIGFLPIALGDVAKAHGISDLAHETGIQRRTLYKIFHKEGNPSFELVARIIEGLGLKMDIGLKKPKKKKAL